MRQDVRTSALQPKLSAEELIEYAPYLTKEFNIRMQTITNLDSTNFQPHHWEEIADAIYREYDNYDGFVVIHGTDTMAYTASALSYALGNLGKPVILTGSQVPPRECLPRRHHGLCGSRHRLWNRYSPGKPQHED